MKICGGKGIAAAVVLCSLFSAACFGVDEQLKAPRGDLFQSLCYDMKGLPGDVWQDSQDTYLKRDNLIALLLAGGASIAMHSTDADKNIAENVARHRAFGSNGADEAFNLIGNPGIHFGATGIWYALAYKAGDEVSRERAWTMMHALATTGTMTVLLKGIVHNDAPNGSNWAWPSGHTSSSFTVAAVLDEFYGPQVGIPAYAGASMVAWRMMDAGDHWASDVVFGAVLGWVVGHTVAGKHKQIEVAGFKLVPMMGGDETGTNMGVNFVKLF